MLLDACSAVIKLYREGVAPAWLAGDLGGESEYAF